MKLENQSRIGGNNLRSSRIALIVGVFLFVSCGVHKVVPEGESLIDKDGATYYLPKTVIVASVPVEKTITTPAEFAYFSQPLLNIKSNIETTYTFGIGEDFTVELAGVRDPNKKFISIYPNGPFKTFSQTLKYNDQGVLTSGNSQSQDRTVEVAVATLETVVKVSASAAMFAQTHDLKIKYRNNADLRKFIDVYNKTDNILVEFPKYFLDLVVHLNTLDELNDNLLVPEVLSEGLEILKADNPKLKIEEFRSELLKGEKPKGFLLTNSELVNAWEIFERGRPKAYKKVESAVEAYKKHEFLKQKAKETVDHSDYLLYEAERKEVLALFTTPKKEKISWKGQFRWTPRSLSDEDKESISNSSELFTLDSVQGIILGSISPEIAPPPEFVLSAVTGKTSKQKAVSINCASLIPNVRSYWQSQLNNGEDHGWHYGIPANSQITASVGNNVILRKRAFIAQHGCVAFLPATTQGQKITSSIELDSVSGALLSSTVGGDSFDPALVNRTGGAISAALDAETARQKAQPAYITELEQKKKVLQLRKDIKDLEEELSPSSP